jgi:hypothetical protein
MKSKEKKRADHSWLGKNSSGRIWLPNRPRAHGTQAILRSTREPDPSGSHMWNAAGYTQVHLSESVQSTASSCRGYRFGVLDHLVANAIFFLYGQCTFQSNGYDDLVSTPGRETKDRPRPGCRGLLRDAGSWFTSVVVVSFHVASAHIFHGLSSEPC